MAEWLASVAGGVLSGVLTGVLFAGATRLLRRRSAPSPAAPPQPRTVFDSEQGWGAPRRPRQRRSGRRRDGAPPLSKAPLPPSPGGPGTPPPPAGWGAPPPVPRGRSAGTRTLVVALVTAGVLAALAAVAVVALDADGPTTGAPPGGGGSGGGSGQLAVAVVLAVVSATVTFVLLVRGRRPTDPADAR